MNAIYQRAEHVLRRVGLVSLKEVVLAMMLLASVSRATVHAESTLSDNDLYAFGHAAYKIGNYVDAAFYFRTLTDRHPNGIIGDPELDHETKTGLYWSEWALKSGLDCLKQCKTCMDQKVVEQQQRPIILPKVDINIRPVEAWEVPPPEIRKPVGFENPISMQPVPDWERSITAYNKLLPYLHVRPKLPEFNIRPELDLDSMRRHQYVVR